MDHCGRRAIIAGLHERARLTGRRVWVLVGPRASPVVKGQVPAEARYACVEGDERWVVLPDV
jgi:hypothetical protein